VTGLDQKLVRLGAFLYRFGIYIRFLDVDRDGDVDRDDVKLVHSHLGERCDNRKH
jgi:hypothetical protein